MATIDQFRTFAHAMPFKPFVVNTAGGRAFTVRHPELVSRSVDERELVVHDENGMHLVDMALVDVFEAAPSPDKPRKGKGAKK